MYPRNLWIIERLARFFLLILSLWCYLEFYIKNTNINLIFKVASQKPTFYKKNHFNSIFTPFFVAVNHQQSCLKDNGGCSHTCTTLSNGRLCTCPQSFTLASNGMKCFTTGTLKYLFYQEHMLFHCIFAPICTYQLVFDCKQHHPNWILGSLLQVTALQKLHHYLIITTCRIILMKKSPKHH